MAQVDITINGRHFRVGCDDGEEAHLLELAAHLRRHVERLRDEFGAVGDDELLLLAGLTVCDELFDARSQMQPQDAARQSGADGVAMPAAMSAGVLQKT